MVTRLLLPIDCTAHALYRGCVGYPFSPGVCSPLGSTWGSVPGRSTQEASFLYDMYLDDEHLEAFMASVDVKGAFPNTPQRLIEEVWRQLGLPYGDFVGKYLRTRRYTVATGKGCTEWVTPGSGVPQGGVEGPFLYMLAMLPLMSWIAREYPELARAPHTSPAQAYVDDAVPLARDGKAQQEVQDLMQRYGSGVNTVPHMCPARSALVAACCCFPSPPLPPGGRANFIWQGGGGCFPTHPA